VCVPIIYGASSLYKKDWFREVFTKLHIFNPDVSPDKDIFNLLKEDVTTPHRHHLKGMTPEQYYLAGMLAPYLTHIDQSYNFEIQLHGGVPLTHKWQHMSYDDIKIVHYSGGEIQSSIYPQVFLGRQDKYMPKKLFNTLPWDVQDLAHHRAKAAWIDFNINLAQAASTTVKKTRDGYNKSNMTLMDIVLERGLIGGYYDDDDDDDDVDDEWYCYDDDKSSDHNEVSDTAYKDTIQIGDSFIDDDGDSIIQWLLVKIILHDNITYIGRGSEGYIE
ncbi:hypothetical protein Pmar_PMAR024124, partial [Perkinsus marinus ATCC 50983]